MAFIFDANAVMSFVFAPILLPLAALPAYCFYVALRGVPTVWRAPGVTHNRKLASAVLALPGAWIVAIVFDLIEIIAIRGVLGIRLPPLPPDGF